MLAAVATGYGSADVIEVRHATPPIPRGGQVRVRVRAVSLNPLDARLRAGTLRPFLRLRFPAILGFDLAGEVESVGPGAESSLMGQRVYGRIDSRTGGAHAQFAVVSASVLDRIPARLTFEQAASLPLTAMTAVQALRDIAQVRAGQRVLIRGATGGVGSVAVQVARELGGTVTGLVKGERIAPGERYHVVFDTVGRGPWTELQRLLEPHGTFVTTGFSAGLAVRAALGWMWSRRRYRFVVSRADGGLMREVSRLVSQGQLDPVIDSTWPLEQIREAYRRLESGHPRGKVVVVLPA